MSGLSLSEVEDSLRMYLQTCWPAMLRQRYHLQLAKGGPGFPDLPEQSLLTHILNGVFGLIRLVRFLVESQVFLPDLNATSLRQALVLYTLHDLGKIPDVEPMDNTDFSISLERVQQEYETLGLSRFAVLDAHLVRAVNVHKRSARQGDLLQTSEPHAARLYILVRLADAMASATSPAEAASSLAGWLARLGPEFSPGGKGRFGLYWHQIRDIRGVLTNVIHQAVAQRLSSDSGFYPLLFFAAGPLYIGPHLDSRRHFDREAFIETVVGEVLQALAKSGDSRDIAREGLRRRKYDFERHVFAFADVRTLLDIVLEETLRAKPDPKQAKEELDELASKREGFGPNWRATAEFRFALSLDEPRALHEHWSRAYRYLLYVDTLLRDLNPAQGRVEWFTRRFPLPTPLIPALKAEGAIWARGGMGKYVLVIAYHFLKGPAFAGTPAEDLPSDEVLRRLHEHALAAFGEVDTKVGRENVVAELGFRPDLRVYLSERILLSWVPEIRAGDDALSVYVGPKRKGHGDRLCSLCNRSSPHVQPLRTGVLDDEGRIFSNRVLPAEEAPGALRPWCPICHLEFVFRKLVGLGLPSGADYGNSRRLYLYILPAFSFTPEHVSLFSRWLGQFQNVTALPVRDYGPEQGIPHRWLLRGELDPDWLEEVEAVLENQGQRIGGKGGSTYVGERLVAGQVRGQPHYYLIVWEKLAGRREQHDDRIATRTEAWAKGILAATIIASLSGCKVYVTERPYLPVADPADLKATIALDSPPASLRLLTAEGITLYGREQGARSGLEKALDLAAALWTVTAEVHASQRQTKDKHVSERLALVNTSRLAGATFYKEYARLNNGRSPGEILVRACQVLLDLQGGDLMDLVTRIAEKALDIRLPYREYERGKVHSYELTFREAVDAMRKAYALIPELREVALTGARPSANSVAELKKQAGGTLFKAMERRSDPQKYRNIINPWRLDLNQTVGQFVDLIVDEAFLGRAGGSFARFQRLENSLADGVYYHTDRVLAEKWDAHNKAKAERKAEARTTESISFEEVSK